MFAEFIKTESNIVANMVYPHPEKIERLVLRSQIKRIE